MGYSRLKTNPKIYFGGYPTRDDMKHLQEQMRVVHIIDLTTPVEKYHLPSYCARDFNMLYTNFPIRDNFIPEDMERFNEFLVWLSVMIESMKENESVYIHCKGGHGRSGLVVSCLLCMMYDKSPLESVQEVSQSHRERPSLSLKWKMRLCPSNYIQRVFIHNLFGKHHHPASTNHLLKEMEIALNAARRRFLYNQSIRVS